jgi:hypothetical protein
MNDLQAQHFATARTETMQLVDRLGMPLDEGIADTVTVMRLLGINTTASCWGHLDRVTGGPYVIFSSPEAKPLELQYRQAGDPHDPLFHRIRDQAVGLNLRERQKLLVHLDAFYRERLTSYGTRLVIMPIGPEGSQLQCQNAELANILSQTDRRHMVQSHQAEMTTFTKFLIQAYYRTNQRAGATP